MHKSFVVFLDIDGVLNVRKSVDEVYAEYRRKTGI